MARVAVMAGARVAVLAALLWPGSAMAQTAEDCAAADLTDAGRAVDLGLPEDLGGGWVLQPFETAGAAGRQTGETAMHCPSGNALAVVRLAFDATGALVMEAGVDIGAVFRAAIASPEPTSIDTIVAELQAGGASVQPQAPTGRESCGCALFYPDARGDQVPWAEWGTP